MRGLLPLLLTLFAPAVAADVASTPDPAIDPCPQAIALAPGVFVIPGAAGPPSRANGGAVANRGFLVGDGGAIVIDPGPTDRPAAALRCAMARHGALPVVAVVNTHPHPENVLANAEFTGLPVYASALASSAMRERCHDCQANFLVAIGQPPFEGRADALLPNRPVAQRTTLQITGRTITLLPLGIAHSPGDLAVIDHTSGTIFAGDLGNDRLPDLRDGSAAGAQAALDALLAEPGIERIVPGRGDVFPPARLRQAAAYLAELRKYAQQRLDQPDGFVPPAKLPAALAGYYPEETERHGLNLQHALREAEESWWQNGPPK